jgi:hypothetical protein
MQHTIAINLKNTYRKELGATTFFTISTLVASFPLLSFCGHKTYTIFLKIKNGHKKDIRYNLG